MTRHYKISRSLIGSLLLGSAIVATGCATTATGVSNSAIMSSAASSAAAKGLVVKAPAGTALAVVRYPAFIEEAAEQQYYESFSKNIIGKGRPEQDFNSPDVQALADSIILKSNYFALSLYKELAERLPEHSVLLSPHTIKLGPDGKLMSEPMTQAESLANVVTVDFVSYTYPDASKMMGGEPLTFGDLVTPIVSVKSDYRASVPTQGVLLASRPIVSRAAANGKARADATRKALQSGRLDTTPTDLDFVTFLNGTRSTQVARKGLNRTGNISAVRAYDVEKVKLDKTAMKSLKSVEGKSVDPLEKSFSSGFANQVVGILNSTDIEKATMGGRAAAIAQFDESLAALTLVGSTDPSYLARLRYAERLMDAEKNYLSVQSLRLFDGVHNGEMGAQIRDMLAAEYATLEKRRKLARQQNAATALAILGAVAAGGAISSQDGNQSLGQRLALEALIQGAIFAGTQAYTMNRRSRAIGDNYLASIVPALEEQTSVQVSLIDSNETITAIRYEDLQAKLQTLYSQNQRALSTVATSCAYTHSGVEKTGRWLGECQGGLASGSGVGTSQLADGTNIEYYGYAQNGQAYGPGFMIYHNLTQSYAVEGNFTAGQADGVMKVTQSGKEDALRTYVAGVNTGKAPSGSMHASPFNGPLSALGIN